MNTLSLHIFLLESAHSDMSLQDKSLETDPESQDTEFKVEKVLNQQDIKSQSHYLIK